MGSSKSLSVAIVFALSAMACNDERPSSLESAVQTDAGIATGLELRLNVAGRDDVFACGTGFTRAEVEDNQVNAIQNAPSRCQGSEGGFVCECDGEHHDSYAFGCVAALYQACAVEAEPVDGLGEDVPFATECSGVVGRCELEDDRYACQCAGDTARDLDAVAPDSPAACEQALFASCGTECRDDFGSCTPSATGTLGEYTCSCGTNQFIHEARAGSCEEALLTACDPFNPSEEVCTGYGGACAVTDHSTQTELSCVCVDRTQRDVEHVPAFEEPRHRACRETLEATCGIGAPPAGAQCIAEGNGYHARCTRGPAADATLTCECYRDGTTDDAREEQVADHDCDMALLLEFCPEITD
jgi:hypothetical protein